MRKLRRRGAAAAPTTPAPAPVVEVQTITPQDVQTVSAAALVAPAVLPPAVLAPTGGGAMAVMQNDPAFLRYGEFDRSASTLPAQQSTWFPTLSFYNDKHADAKAALPGLAVGSPYLKVDGEYFDASGIAFLSLAEVSYWCTTDPAANYAPKDYYINPSTPADPDLKRNNSPRTVASSYGVTKAGEKINERILSMTLILPGEKPLHEDLGMAILTLTDWRQATCNALRQHCDAVEATTGQSDSAKAWAKANGPLVNWPPRFRIASVLRASGRGNPPYAVATSKCVPMSVAQGAALAAYWEDADLAEERQGIDAAFSAKIAEIRGKALDR